MGGEVNFVNIKSSSTNINEQKVEKQFADCLLIVGFRMTHQLHAPEDECKFYWGLNIRSSLGCQSLLNPHSKHSMGHLALQLIYFGSCDSAILYVWTQTERHVFGRARKCVVRFQPAAPPTIPENSLAAFWTRYQWHSLPLFVVVFLTSQFRISAVLFQGC